MPSSLYLCAVARPPRAESKPMSVDRGTHVARLPLDADGSVHLTWDVGHRPGRFGGTLPSQFTHYTFATDSTGEIMVFRITLADRLCTPTRLEVLDGQSRGVLSAQNVAYADPGQLIQFEIPRRHTLNMLMDGVRLRSSARTPVQILCPQQQRATAGGRIV